MPRLADPPRGWIATANNRPAPDDFPYPLSGTWSSGHRARRIRQMLEAKPVLDRDDVMEMHQDALSLRAVECLPRLLAWLRSWSESRRATAGIAAAVAHLEAWDCRMEPDRVGGLDLQRVLLPVLPGRRRRALRRRGRRSCWRGAAGGPRDRAPGPRIPRGWFAGGQSRGSPLLAPFRTRWTELVERCGPDPASWTWGDSTRSS